jgi:hypothetical protein
MQGFQGTRRQAGGSQRNLSHSGILDGRQVGELLVGDAGDAGIVEIVDRDAEHLGQGTRHPQGRRMLIGSQLPDVLRRASHSARLDRLGQFLVGIRRTAAAMHNANQVVQLIAKRLCGQFRLPGRACRVPLRARKARQACWSSHYDLHRSPVACSSLSRLAETALGLLRGGDCVDRTTLGPGKLWTCETIVSFGRPHSGALRSGGIRSRRNRSSLTDTLPTSPVSEPRKVITCLRQ